MNGLELARAYYNTYMPQLLDAVPQARGRIAAGLIGEGSQCFGFDDEISRDHDFGPGFCIWLSDEDYDAFGTKLQQAYDGLPKTFCGFDCSNILASDRLGVMKISDFYRRFTGTPLGIPETNIDWLFTPETALAAATNGKVFCDDIGEFSAIRSRLLEFYPEDVRRKKIAARAAVMSQAGQYNLLRLIKRGDIVAATQALGRFTEATLSMIYLLKKQYMPFYKWSFHGLRIDENDELAKQLCPLIEALPGIIPLLQERDFDGAHRLAFRLTEEICQHIATELNRQGLSQTKSPFLQDHLNDIMAGISDPKLRALPPMFDSQN